MLDYIRDLEHVHIRDLYALYPEMDIDIRAEQAALLEHDIIVFHHPFFWYSVPPILKEWQDLVLEHGWAYGREGSALEGKWFLSVLTTGGQREAYCEEGYNNYTIRQLLAPLRQTATLCRMQNLPPFVVHGTHVISSDEVRRHAARYRRLLTFIGDDTQELRSLVDTPYLNDIPQLAEGRDHA